MSRTKKMGIRIFLLLTVLVLILPHAVFGAEEDSLMDSLAEDAPSFLSEVYTSSDEKLDSSRKQGGFYEVLVRSWYEDREVTGEFKEVLSTEAEQSSDGKQIITTSVVEFENYTSDVVMYFDAKTGSPVNYVMNIRYSMKEKMTQAAQNMAVGLIVVFAVLVFLMFIIFLFRLLSPSKKKEPRKETIPSLHEKASAPEEVVSMISPRPETETACADNSEEEIAAVIAAAVAAASAESPAAGGYVVRSVRRGSRSVWKRV